jgi:hypothetical protein
VLDAQQYVQYNFVLTSGVRSQYKANSPLQELRVQPQGIAIKRTVLWYDSVDAQLVGLQFFDKDGHKLLETGWKFHS